jgi:hypothetical protein
MILTDKLNRWRKAFLQGAWSDAYDLLTSADRETSLEPEDLEQLARAAYLIGKETESTDIWARAHHEFLSRGNTRKAVYCAFWLGMILFNLGEGA